ncbi:MAG: hypothetical protein WDM85_09940 [Caulobacteraceae bacterium]
MSAISNGPRAFYDPLLKFLGFEILGEYGDMMGWTNGKTRLWIAQADAQGSAYKYRFHDVGFHHYAWELGSRKEVDQLQAWLKRPDRRSSIRPGNITKTTMRSSSSIRTDSSWRG